MVLRAQKNAEYNTIDNVDFFAANLMDSTMLITAPWIQKTYDKILLDPPRSGAKEIVALIPSLKPKRIVYVSCNPATLARDAKELVHQHRYQLKAAGVINMFPHTSHIEAMAVFDR